MNNVKDELADLINKMDEVSINKKILNDYFGRDNLSKLPFDFLTVDIDDFHKCTIYLESGYTVMYSKRSNLAPGIGVAIKRDDLPKIKEELFKKLKTY